MVLADVVLLGQVRDDALGAVVEFGGDDDQLMARVEFLGHFFDAESFLECTIEGDFRIIRPKFLLIGLVDSCDVGIFERAYP